MQSVRCVRAKLIGDTLSSAIFPTRPAFLYGAVRVLGSGGGELELELELELGLWN